MCSTERDGVKGEEGAIERNAVFKSWNLLSAAEEEANVDGDDDNDLDEQQEHTTMTW